LRRWESGDANAVAAAGSEDEAGTAGRSGWWRGWDWAVFHGEIPCVLLKKIAMLYVPLKKFSGLQRHCSNFFVLSMPLPSV